MPPPYLHPYFPSLEPQKRWLFRVEFTIPGNNVVREILNIHAQSVTVPHFNVDPIIIPHLNQDVKFAGRPSVGDLTVSFLTAYNSDAVMQLERWMRLIYQTQNETMGFARQYKGSCDVLILWPNHELFKGYKCLGVWPNSIGDTDMDWSANDHIVRQASFNVDKVLEPEDGGYLGQLYNTAASNSNFLESIAGNTPLG